MTEINNILEGHYSTETKVKRPKITVAEAPAALPKHTLFSEKEAKQKINAINTDIYQGTKKEKAKNDFNTIFVHLPKEKKMKALATAGIAGINKIRDFFRKS